MPLHRRPPSPETVIPQNRYVSVIIAVRENYHEAVKRYDDRLKAYNAWKKAADENRELHASDAGVEMKDEERRDHETPNPFERPTGPIDWAIKQIKDFAAAGSGWTSQHLAHFQVVVLDNQTAPHLFPGVFLIPDIDPTRSPSAKTAF